MRVLAFSLAALLAAAGYSMTGPAPDAEAAGPALGATPVDEDPEVLAHVKAKGWWLITDVRIADGKRLVFLTPQDKAKSYEDIDLTPADFAMIARSKSAQVVDLMKVKNTDDAALKVIAAMPRIEGVAVKSEVVTDAGIKALAGCKTLDFVTLFGTKKVTDAGVKELAALPKLKTLHLSFFALDGSAFAAFAGSPTLESVTLDYIDGFTDDGARNLAKLPKLNELKLGSGKQLTAAGIKAVVDARLPAKFEFDKKLIDDALFASLVAKGWLYGPSPPGTKSPKPATAADVKSINLEGSSVTDEGFKAVRDCTNATHLFLGRTGVTDETLKAAAAFSRLNYLALEKSKVTAAGLDAVAGLPLKHVAVEGSELSEGMFRAFGKMAALEELWLSDSKMTPDWVKHLSGLSKLKELNLRQAAFDDAAAKHVAGLPALENLTLNGTNLGDAGFAELLKLPKLKSLYVDYTKVSKDVYKRAKKDHPKLTLYFYRHDH